MTLRPVSRRWRRASRRVRQARMLAQALRHKTRPVAAHLIPIRRCNLACAYCNEYDDHSAPVATSDLVRRVDLLAGLGTGIVTFSGGEPLLHPDLDVVIRRIRSQGMIATLITNGYLLTRRRIQALNRAGLDHLQISIDNVVPDEISKKSLKVLDRKLQWLSEDADFDVVINTVVGGGVRNPDDATVIATRARELGLSVTVGIIHDHSGQLLPLEPHQREIVDEIGTSGTSTFDISSYNSFQKNQANGRPNEWHCRAGARYLYVCEDGLVHWCSQQRGRPGIPLERYTSADVEREYHREKTCAPWCTVGCVHRVAQVDDLRRDPVGTVGEWFAPMPGPSDAGVAAREGATAPVDTLRSPRRRSQMPVAVKALTWMFATSRHSATFRSAAQRVFGIR
jgi:MoaA/NifB/PqqE/SkfB family radical SAM enzyme